MRPDARLVWATKGLEAETGRLLQDVAREALGDTIPLARRQFTIDWLQQQPQLQALTDDALRGLIREQSLLVWRLPDAARASLPETATH
jgi:hypothetical protein